MEEKPERLIGDRAYDSDPLDDRLQQQGIDMIAPHKSNRMKPALQDGRPLRKYKKALDSGTPGCRTSEEFRCAMIAVSRTISPFLARSYDYLSPKSFL